MIKISHEFPKNYYLEGFTEDLVDYQYCLAHRFLSDAAYRNYFYKYKDLGGEVYLDNSLYELGEAFDRSMYMKIICTLKPDYYFLPDVFNQTTSNIESQLSFFKNVGPVSYIDSKPVAVCHGMTPKDIISSFRILNSALPDYAMIAIPFGSHAWLNEEDDPKYLRKSKCENDSARMAANRGIFLNRYYKTLKKRNIHLLGCKGLREIPFINCLESADFIRSIDTSLPVASALEDNEIKMDYKPKFLIDKNFDMPVKNADLVRKNVEDFRKQFHTK